MPSAAQKEASLKNLQRGRPVGSISKWTRVRHDFLDKLFGMPGSEELQEFAAAIRKQFIDGTIHPQIGVFIMQHWMGVPKQKVEVDINMPALSSMTDAELAERAILVAEVIASPDTQRQLPPLMTGEVPAEQTNDDKVTTT
jgi:hypothetical protein